MRCASSRDSGSTGASGIGSRGGKSNGGTMMRSVGGANRGARPPLAAPRDGRKGPGRGEAALASKRKGAEDDGGGGGGGGGARRAGDAAAGATTGWRASEGAGADGGVS